MAICQCIFLWYSHTEDRDTNMVPLAQMAVLPKHCHLPEIPSDPNMSFEAMLYFFGVIAMGLQYINLYRTVWWLPHSHANYALVIIIFNFFKLRFCHKNVVNCFIKLKNTINLYIKKSTFIYLSCLKHLTLKLNSNHAVFFSRTFIWLMCTLCCFCVSWWAGELYGVLFKR